jgi:transcriptional regulator GlxA family with amidase domain
MREGRKPVIALLAAPETSPPVLYGLFDVLLSVGAVYPELVGGTTGEPLLDVRIVAADLAPFRCVAGNIAVEPHASLTTIGHVDVAIVCDINTPIDTPPKGRYPAEIAWLRQVHAGGALLGSVCSGSLVLAEAGLLDGRRCAGHWAYRDLFRRAYPKVEFVIDSVLCLESEAEGIVTAGSVSSWQDLALYVIARLCGNEHALRAAKVYLLSDHGDGQLPFAMMNRRVQKDDGAIARCQMWIADNYASNNPVGAMVEQTGLNRRTFMRRFRAATGYLPLEYVHRLRIEEAKQIIEREAENLDEVGSMVGYEDPAFFRRLFKRQTGLTPAAYRRKVAPIMSLAAGVPKQRH